MPLSTWQTKKAKAKFSQLVKASLEKGDQFITFRKKLVAVVISKERYDELTRPKGSLIDFFKEAPLSDVDLDGLKRQAFPRDISI